MNEGHGILDSQIVGLTKVEAACATREELTLTRASSQSRLWKFFIQNITLLHSSELVFLNYCLLVLSYALWTMSWGRDGTVDMVVMLSPGAPYNGNILKSRKSLKSSNKNDCRILAFIQGYDDLNLYILNGLGSDFREITAPIRAREKPLAFEELHDMLVGHDAYLQRLETTTQQLVASANYSNRRPASSSGGQHFKGNFKNGYGRNGGSSRQDSNQGSYRPSGGPNNSKKSTRQRKYTPKCQICDELGHIAKHCPSSHNITGDLANLSIYCEYDGTDEVVIDHGAVLLKGACENDVYTLPNLLVQAFPKMVANVHERTSING
ncbi:hypothetical protein AAG906_004906 [Vitis piasezkii]